MAGLINLFGSGVAINYGEFKNRCRSCGADLDDFLSFDASGEILRCLICNEEVPIDDVAISGRCYQPLYARSIRCKYFEHEYERKIWRKSWRRTPK